MTGKGKQQVDLARRLVEMAESMVATSRATLSDGAIRELPALVKVARQQLLDDGDPRLIDAEAACVVELLTALSYARSDKNINRENRMVMFLNSFITFMRTDLARADAIERAAL